MVFKSLLITSLTSFAFLSPMASSANEKLNITKAKATSKITVEITNITVMEGNINIAIFNSKDNWLGKSVHSTVLAIDKQHCEESKCRWQIDNIDYDDYGIAAFHDLNSDGKMEYNFIGIPQEAYGFSNNETSVFGLPPKWKAAKFTVNQAELVHRIKF